MKRNSTTIWIPSPSGDPANPTITPVPWDNVLKQPVWGNSDITFESLAIVQAAYEANKGNISVVPDPDPLEDSWAAATRSIDARRLRLALLQLEKLDEVEAAISTLGRAAQIEWEFATEIRKDYPLVKALATNLKLDIDEIFTLADSLS